MSESNGAQFGVSSPLSTAPPSRQDTELGETLLTELKAQNNFESPEETAKRNSVLQKLQKLLQKLVQDVGKKKGMSPELLKEAGGKIFTYGSYRLGVYGPGSDIDSLMVAPKHVSRDDFFERMPGMIRATFKPEEITEMVVVAAAAVPIIKTKLMGVDIDLIFANLQRDSIPTNLDLGDTNLLRGLDDTDLKCVNGTRVTDRILTLVPQTRIFRIALRAVKLWAQKRAVYGAIACYPGGVAYGMIVARVCQLYPNAAAPKIVQKFFWLLHTWAWPSPIYLQAREKGPLGKTEWDPTTNPGDKRHLMPVITPAYPCMNSTHTITPSTMAVLKKESDRGEKIMNEIYEGKRPWKDLFAKHTFFSDAYQHYICIITAARTKDAQQAWSGLVQSRVKRLLAGIEQSDADSVKLVQPFNKGIARRHECKSEADIEKTLAGGLECQVGESKTADQSAEVKAQVAAHEEDDGSTLANAAADGTTIEKKDNITEIWTTTFYLGIELIKGAKNLDISWPIQDFKRQVIDWDGYDSKMHSVQIKHVRDYQLPDDLFTEGEKRPVKKKKPKKTDTAAENDKKRSFTNTGLDENLDPAKRRQSGNVPGMTAAKANGSATPNGSAG
ncbi:uncharacterized protein MYCFIDRAFT_49534 [Pseudocercospora fijiensis CIRAD86]|uniref:Poly(A) polymerase n=1 Tax=Pseudocercospora fijiensis (strain CIRAD86) TaxID=383855 RepID=M3BBI2_PSEFD|nr:uncharacterized protein MYCFIDRAFT_49534 [Pseudocercospora fijiensis CIRAD86]EME86652.1 hypothetical protein MYCFIDRAFT_49534 [Pseudocercospora fijiensis CIRAD86]